MYRRSRRSTWQSSLYFWNNLEKFYLSGPTLRQRHRWSGLFFLLIYVLNSSPKHRSLYGTLFLCSKYCIVIEIVWSLLVTKEKTPFLQLYKNLNSLDSIEIIGLIKVSMTLIWRQLKKEVIKLHRIIYLIFFIKWIRNL